MAVVDAENDARWRDQDDRPGQDRGVARVVGDLARAAWRDDDGAITRVRGLPRLAATLGLGDARRRRAQRPQRDHREERYAAGAHASSYHERDGVV